MFRLKRKHVDEGALIAEQRKHILSKGTDFFIRESYNTLRTNLNFSLTDQGCKVIALTSTIPQEGKSITSLNLAVSFAEVGKKVLIIDADMRKPKIHKLLQMKSKPGLSNLLIRECSIDEAIKTDTKYGVDAIVSGDIPPNSTQLLESDALDEILSILKSRYDYIIIDTPPINIVIDACILVKHTSGVVFVIKQNYAKKDAIVNAVRQIEYSKGRILGFVFNDIADKSLLQFTNYKYKKYRYNSYKRYKYTSSSELPAADMRDKKS